ncbi:MAG: hypothetical protein ACFFDN_33320 [Candidatus Hodarchaeota archaeon]
MKKQSPLSRKNIFAYLGIDITLGALLSIAANIIQVLTLKNGVIIFSSIFVSSIIILIIRLISYQKSSISKLNIYLDEIKLENDKLKSRLRTLITEIRSRSAINPKPMIVNAWVNTKKFQQIGTQVKALSIKNNIVVLNKGQIDGLCVGMCFAIFIKNNNTCLETGTIEYVEEDRSWLKHTGENINSNTSCDDLILHCTDPIEIHETEKELGEYILLIEGFKEN